MDIQTLHHVSINVRDLELSRKFYREVLGLPEIARPNFDFPGVWFRLGAEQQLHLIVHTDPTFRGEKGVDSRDQHFALRVTSYRRTLESLRALGYSDDLPALDLKKMRINPKAVAGFPQIYILDPDRNIIEINAEKLD